MAQVGIVIAKTKGGLYAIADEAGLTVIDGTEVQFDTLATFSDPLSTEAGYVDTGQPGWVALAS